MRWILTLLLFLSISVFAQDQETAQAKAYFEAKDYKKALEIYETLLQEKLKPWQKTHLMYNIGTVLIEQGNYDRAIAQLKSIPKTSPWLRQRINTNLVVARYRYAKMLAKHDSLDALTKSIFHLREALLEGKFRSAVKEELATLLKLYNEEKISQATLEKELPLLLSGTQSAIDQVQFLQAKNLKDKLKKRYLEHYSTTIETWLPLWDQLKPKDNAEEKFRQGLEQMKQGELEQSLQAFHESYNALNQLMLFLWGADPLVEQLQKLVNSYNRVLAQVPIQEVTLYGLIREQKQTKQVVQQSTEFDEAEKNLEMAIQPLSRIHLEEARQWIKRLIAKVGPTKENIPEAILETIIDEQKHAISLNRIVNGEVIGILKGAQEITLDKASLFHEEVLKHQKQEFEQQCQRQPWENVLPLFDLGHQAARKSLTLIDSSTEIAMAYQEEALQHWKEVLKRLRQPKPVEEKEPIAVEEILERPPPGEEKPSADEILRQLQEMEYDDRGPPKEPKIPQKGLKPW